MKNHFRLSSIAFLFLLGCSNQTTVAEKTDTNTKVENVDSSKVTPPAERRMASAAEIMARKQVPVLCYHHIRSVPAISKSSAGYDVTTTQFKETMKALKDSGYSTILPDQYYNYLVYGDALPAKPVMITFDDTDEEQFSIAKPEMDKYGFKAVYFIMTISIDRPRYMTKAQIKQLSDEGHVIGSHTWDHHRVDRLKDDEWAAQFDKPEKKLQEITGKKIEYFAYPFGVWNQAALPRLKERGYKLSFQLSTKRDSLEPLQTVRRMIVAPQWTAQGILKVMKTTFP